MDSLPVIDLEISLNGSFLISFATGHDPKQESIRHDWHSNAIGFSVVRSRPHSGRALMSEKVKYCKEPGDAACSTEIASGVFYLGMGIPRSCEKHPVQVS